VQKKMKNRVLKKRRRLIQGAAMSPLMLGFGSASRAVTPVNPLEIQDYAGRVLLVDFWASWCGPCRLSMPWLNQINTRYSGRGLEIVGVNVDEDTANARAFLDTFPANFDIIYDPEGRYARYFALQAMPTSILFDRNGEEISRHNGFLTDQTAEYEATVEAALQA